MPTFDFTSPEGKTYSVEGPEGATKEQAFAVLQQQLSGGSEPVTATGLAKSLGVGAGEGLIGLAGAPADLAALGAKGIDKLAGSNLQQKIAPITDAAGSQNLQKIVEGYTGEFRKPQNRAEEIAGTVGQFTPLAIGGPAGIGRRIATQVLAPAAGTEIAGELTKGTEAEPYARVAGAVVGGGLGARAGRSIAEAKQSLGAAPLNEMKANTSAAYDNLTAQNIGIPIPQTIDQALNVKPGLVAIADDIKAGLNKEGLRPSNAGGVHAALDELKAPATPGAPDVVDLVTARKTLKNFLGSPDANKAAAAAAIPKIEMEIQRLSPGTMAELRTQDKNWAAVRASEALDKKVAAAQLRAEATHSGMNVGNKIRQNVASLLLSKQGQYLSDANKAILEKVAGGTLPQNLMRKASNMLGGGGGLGSTFLGIGGATAGYQTGHPELAGLPIAGLGLRMALNRSTIKAAEKAAAQIRANSPYGQAKIATLPKVQEQAIIRGLLSAALANQPLAVPVR